MSRKRLSDPGPQNVLWWNRALDLEAEGRFEEADMAITGAIDHLGAYSQPAYLHELRFEQAVADRDFAEAQAAFERAESWLYSYAGGATSGGEGMALSAERDQRISHMRAKLHRWT